MSALKQEKIWFSPTSYFNDPFEFRLRRNSRAKGLETFRAENSHLAGMSDQEFTQKACDEFQEKIMNSAVACFSRCEKNLLMWGHYADSHHGMCMQFTLDENQTLNEVGLHPVQYEISYPQIDFERVWHKDGLAKVMLTKSQDWKYEKELRLINFNYPNGALLDYPFKLTGIIFGFRTKVDKVNLVQSVLENREVQFYKARLADSEYKLEIDCI